MKPKLWDVWYVDMPYDDGDKSGIRPALVISDSSVIIVGKMTKHPPRLNYPYEYPLYDWQGAGLRIPTTLRLSKRIRLDASRFKRKIGVLQPVDQLYVRDILQRIEEESKS